MSRRILELVLQSQDSLSIPPAPKSVYIRSCAYTNLTDITHFTHKAECQFLCLWFLVVSGKMIDCWYNLLKDREVHFGSASISSMRSKLILFEGLTIAYEHVPQIIVNYDVDKGEKFSPELLKLDFIIRSFYGLRHCREYYC